MRIVVCSNWLVRAIALVCLLPFSNERLAFWAVSLVAISSLIASGAAVLSGTARSWIFALLCLGPFGLFLVLQEGWTLSPAGSLIPSDIVVHLEFALILGAPFSWCLATSASGLRYPSEPQMRPKPADINVIRLRSALVLSLLSIRPFHQMRSPSRAES